MRHNVYGAHLGRDKNQRTALFKGLVQSLIFSESIQTTEAKAKSIKGLVDKIINQSKTESTRRLVAQFIVNKQAQEKLIKELLPRLKDRTSGYTSLVKLGTRQGDGAMMVKMSLLLSEPKAKVEKKTAEKSELNAAVDVKQEKPKTVKAKKEVAASTKGDK